MKGFKHRLGPHSYDQAGFTTPGRLLMHVRPPPGTQRFGNRYTETWLRESSVKSWRSQSAHRPSSSNPAS